MAPVVILRCGLAALSVVAALGCGTADARDDGVRQGARDAGPPGIAGVLSTAGGEPLRTSSVMACMATVCLFGDTDVHGRFRFDIDAPAELAIKTRPNLTSRPRLAATLRPVRLELPALLDIGVVRVPELPEGTRFGAAASSPQTLYAGDGLELTVDRASLTPSLGDTLVDIAATRVPTEWLPALPELAGERLLAVYALHPFAAKSERPIGVRAPAAVPIGTPVRFRTISELDGRLSDPAIGSAGQQFVSTATDDGIFELTWLVISM